MYARIENDEVAEYPLSFRELKNKFSLLPDGRRIAIPRGKDFTVDDNVYVIVQPSDNPSGKFEEVTPVFVNGVWKQKFNAVAHTKEELNALNEAKREALIAQGATFDGITVKTDQRTLIFFTNLMIMASADSNFGYNGFNAINGRFDLTNTQIKGLYTAGQAAIKAAFDIYNSVDEDIEAGDITTVDEINEEYEA